MNINEMPLRPCEHFGPGSSGATLRKATENLPSTVQDGINRAVVWHKTIHAAQQHGLPTVLNGLEEQDTGAALRDSGNALNRILSENGLQGITDK